MRRVRVARLIRPMHVPITARSSAQDGASRAYLDHVRRDAAFHGFIAAYAIVGLLIGFAAGVPHKFAPFTYAGMVLMALPQPLAPWRAGMGDGSFARARRCRRFAPTSRNC